MKHGVISPTVVRTRNESSKSWYSTFSGLPGLLWRPGRPENVAQLRAHIVKLRRALSEDLCRKVVTNARVGSFARGCEAKQWSH